MYYIFLHIRVENKSCELKKGHIYELPSQQLYVKQETESIVNPGYAVQAHKEEKSQKQNTESGKGKVTLKEDPTYHCVSYNKL